MQNKKAFENSCYMTHNSLFNPVSKMYFRFAFLTTVFLPNSNLKNKLNKHTSNSINGLVSERLKFIAIQKLYL